MSARSANDMGDTDKVPYVHERTPYVITTAPLHTYRRAFSLLWLIARLRLSPTPNITASERKPMIPDNTPLNRKEIARLLAVVIYRQLRTFHTPQNLAPPGQDPLDVLPKEVLSGSKTVNTNGEQGEQ